MTAEHVSTFVLFGTGYDPSLVRLGDLVLHKYSNPLAVRHYTCTIDPRPDDIVSTPVRNVCVTKSQKPGIGFAVEALDLVQLKVKLAASHQTALTAESGQRIVLKSPDTYLRENVFTDQKAVESLALWLSAARSEYMMKIKWLRKPKVWMCTGLYLLEKSKLMTSRAQFPEVATGVSSTVIGGLTSVPLGGSFELTREKTLEAAMEFPGRAVWAAQYQLLDTKYAVNGETNQESIKSINLLPDITSMSRGSLRRVDDGSDVLVQVSPIYDDDLDNQSHEDETETYYESLDAAIVVFEEVLNSVDSEDE